MTVTTLKRCFSLVLLTLLSVSVYYQAVGAVRLAVQVVLDATRSLAALSAREGSGEAPPESPRQAPRAAQATTPARGPGAAATPSFPECEGIQVVIVTESSDPTWSAATFKVKGEARPRPRRVGDTVEGRKVTFIGFDPKQQLPSVWLEDEEGQCQALLLGSRSATGELHAVRAPAAKPAFASRIQKLGDAAFLVDRALVDQVLEDPSELMRVRIVPDRKDGKTLGLKLHGIRDDSLLAALGLRTGDRLESINGFAVASPEAALQAYARLRAASHLSVKLERAGRPHAIDVEIR